jgi:hypothetical protein
MAAGAEMAKTAAAANKRNPFMLLSLGERAQCKPETRPATQFNRHSPSAALFTPKLIDFRDFGKPVVASDADFADPGHLSGRVSRDPVPQHGVTSQR